MPNRINRKNKLGRNFFTRGLAIIGVLFIAIWTVVLIADYQKSDESLNESLKQPLVDAMDDSKDGIDVIVETINRYPMSEKDIASSNDEGELNPVDTTLSVSLTLINNFDKIVNVNNLDVALIDRRGKDIIPENINANDAGKLVVLPGERGGPIVANFEVNSREEFDSLYVKYDGGLEDEKVIPLR